MSLSKKLTFLRPLFKGPLAGWSRLGRWQRWYLGLSLLLLVGGLGSWGYFRYGASDFQDIGPRDILEFVSKETTQVIFLPELATSLSDLGSFTSSLSQRLGAPEFSTQLATRLAEGLGFNPFVPAELRQMGLHPHGQVVSFVEPLTGESILILTLKHRGKFKQQFKEILTKIAKADVFKEEVREAASWQTAEKVLGNESFPLMYAVYWGKYVLLGRDTSKEALSNVLKGVASTSAQSGRKAAASLSSGTSGQQEAPLPAMSAQLAAFSLEPQATFKLYLQDPQDALAEALALEGVNAGGAFSARLLSEVKFTAHSWSLFALLQTPALKHLPAAGDSTKVQKKFSFKPLLAAAKGLGGEPLLVGLSDLQVLGQPAWQAEFFAGLEPRDKAQLELVNASLAALAGPVGMAIYGDEFRHLWQRYREHKDFERSMKESIQVIWRLVLAEPAKWSANLERLGKTWPKLVKVKPASNKLPTATLKVDEFRLGADFSLQGALKDEQYFLTAGKDMLERALAYRTTETLFKTLEAGVLGSLVQDLEPWAAKFPSAAVWGSIGSLRLQALAELLEPIFQSEIAPEAAMNMDLKTLLQNFLRLLRALDEIAWSSAVTADGVYLQLRDKLK